ncbi:class I SAM-dependent methyltransferase [Amycolatopsis sp. H20-H5]|uniref:class I SAM-dependent methyltransferase n=1 Tax=Amycolatopsis sp. H20-H5 TaxID=3046309 RepID=UPI002DB71EDB|nr:class I SAM-dependent methyltransferase [Amycolatopsis sp. H20-H5]MEC3981849.1 class I SAM-dependent methyltransferase [Amycolatopsis sp. H20-H5]
MNDTTAADLFDDMAEHYDEDLFHLTVAQALIDGLAGGPAPELVLDVATGTGIAAFAALRLAPARIVAVDISPRMITRATVKSAEQDPGTRITWRVGPAVPAAAEPASADVVLCASSLHFLGAEALHDWLRVLRPGGRVAFSLPPASAFRPSPAFAALVPAGLKLPDDEKEAAALAAGAGFVAANARRIDATGDRPRAAFLVHATKPGGNG